MREVLIAARRRMNQQFPNQHSQADFRSLRQRFGDQIARWFTRLFHARRTVDRAAVEGTHALSFLPQSPLRSVDDVAKLGTHLNVETQNERLREALASLDPVDLELILMRHLDQFSVAEIALALGMTESVVKQRILRALLRLRESMDLSA